MKSIDGKRRVVVEGVKPEVDCGRFAIKRISGDTVSVEADVFADGHDVVTAVL
ncbi:MAG TPA: maltotransferase domain-containing protein, partial [Actinomycetota bacterium]